MPSTYSPILRVELPATGEQAGTWGTAVNTMTGTVLEGAIAGTATVALPAGAADYTLTALNGVDDEARKAVLKITAALTANRNVICPAVSKLYFVHNATSGAYTVTLKTSAGTGIAIPQGNKTWLYCDGTNVVIAGDPAVAITNATSKATPVDADKFGFWDSVTGLFNNFTWANLKTTLTAANIFIGKTSATGSAILPASTTANRDGSPVVGYLRYNTNLSQFEGYGSSGWGKVGGGTTGGSTDAAFYENDATITTSYTIGAAGLISGATITNASPAVVTLTGHGFILDSQVFFETTGGLPTGLTVDTGYWVISAGLTANAFELSATQGGAAINTSSAGSGVHSCGKLKNATSAGTQTIATGATVTVPTGATWVIG